MSSSNKRQKIDDGCEQIRKHQAALQAAVQTALSEKDEQIRGLQAALKTTMNALLSVDDHGTFMANSWADLPPEVRDEKVCIIKAIQHHRIFDKNVIPFHLRNDREIAMEAYHQGMDFGIEIRLTPDQWCGNVNLSLLALRQGSIQNLADAPALTRDIVCKALKEEKKFLKLRWEHLPVELKNNPNFCRRVVGYSVSIAENVFQQHCGLRQEREVWETILASNNVRYGISGLFQEYAPPTELLEDAIFMRNAIEKKKYVLEYVHPALYTEIVENNVKTSPENLAHISRDFIEASPVFVKSQLAHFCHAVPNIFDLDALAGKIPADWWLDDTFLTDWFLAGLPGHYSMLPHRNQPQWNSDRDKLLLVAEHCARPDWKQKTLLCATNEVRNDPVFFTKVMHFDPCLFEAASATLRAENFELAVWALSAPRFVARCRQAIGVPLLTNAAMDNIRLQASQKLAMHDAFFTLLCGISVPGEPLSHLNLLDVKLLLSEFAGVPLGDHLVHIRRALTNLAADGNERR